VQQVEAHQQLPHHGREQGGVEVEEGAVTVLVAVLMENQTPSTVPTVVSEE